MDSLLCQFTATGYIVTAICGIARTHPGSLSCSSELAIYNKVKATLGGLWQGIISLKGVQKCTALHRPYTWASGWALSSTTISPSNASMQPPILV